MVFFCLFGRQSGEVRPVPAGGGTAGRAHAGSYGCRKAFFSHCRCRTGASKALRGKRGKPFCGAQERFAGVIFPEALPAGRFLQVHGRLLPWKWCFSAFSERQGGEVRPVSAGGGGGKGFFPGKTGSYPFGARNTKRVISEGTPRRQENPFHRPVPGLT